MWQSKSRWILLAVIVILLIGTHWLAYRRGVRSENEKIGHMGRELIAINEVDAFRYILVILQMAERSPQALSSSKVNMYCRRIKNLAKDVERACVSVNRQIGNDSEADRWQKEIDEAHRLAEKMCPDEKK